MAISAIFLLLFLHILRFIANSSAEIGGLDSFLAQQYRVDPHATNDSFLSLSAVLKTSLETSLICLHLPLPFSVPFTVKLVGSTFTSSSPSLLKSFLSFTISSDHFHVITPFSSSSSHHFSLSHNLHLDVSLSFSSLSTHISEALKNHISDTPSSLRSPLASVRCSVDEIIKEDFEKVKSYEEIYIYILHLGSQSKPYAYSYTQGD